MTRKQKHDLLRRLQKAYEKGNTIQSIELPESCKVEIIGYTIRISKDEYDNWQSKIYFNEKLDSQIIGILMGRTIPEIIITEK